MSTRLLSLLSDIEHALLAETPAPAGGAWDNSRMVNYQSGLARLTLAARTGENSARTLGTILLQAFDLADRSFCLKANLCWSEGPGAADVVHALYEKPGMNWESEARQIAAKWAAGPVAAAKPEESQEPLAAAG